MGLPQLEAPLQVDPPPKNGKRPAESPERATSPAHQPARVVKRKVPIRNQSREDLVSAFRTEKDAVEKYLHETKNLETKVHAVALDTDISDADIATYERMFSGLKRVLLRHKKELLHIKNRLDYEIEQHEIEILCSAET